MKKEAKEKNNWTVCQDCLGQGKKSRKLRKKVRLRFQMELALFEKTKSKGTAPQAPKRNLYTCTNCSGTGLIPADCPPESDTKNYPHIAIIGAGIGGVALAAACLNRGIPFTLYERDNDFHARSQGYGLTLQQATKTMEGLGIFSLEKGVISTRHLVHTTEGKVIGEWGMRKWMPSDTKSSPKRTNVHIARQSLRFALIQQLGGEKAVHWGHQLMDAKEGADNGIDLRFLVNGKIKKTRADLVVGADGIRSSLRNLLIGEQKTPLRYLGCIVILGICKLETLETVDRSLLDSATVFQTANGNERIYMMPFSSDTIMWQLSFPMNEKEAIALSKQGTAALKEEACRRTPWHEPIPQILSASPEAQISGYPVYDREILQAKLLEKIGAYTLIGDAAHPMSPFKGQGANQALMDALSLARGITKGCRIQSRWRETGLRATVLTDFESEMIARTAIKVKDSAAAADFLHSDIVLHEGDEPRGKFLKKKNAEKGKT